MTSRQSNRISESTWKKANTVVFSSEHVKEKKNQQKTFIIQNGKKITVFVSEEIYPHNTKKWMESIVSE